MYRVAIFLVSLIAIFSCRSEKTIVKSDLEIANLKGNVWQIEKTIFHANLQCACPAAQKTEDNKTKYVYDRKGMLIESYVINEEGDTSINSKYLYNRQGMCKEVHKFEGENLVGKEIPVFQGSKLTSYKILDKNGINEMTMDYVYSGEEIAEEKTLTGNGKVVSVVKNEFANGQLVSQTVEDSTGQVKDIRRFKRNSNGDLIEFIISIPKDSAEYKLTYEYEYDKAGNWTKQTRFYDDQIEYIVIRNIEYYNSL